MWIATAAGLDWPKTTNPDEQRSSLREMVRSLKAANFNTIFFQARARGDAYYRSRLEPWAENLTGTLGASPGWDPLAFLLDEAHRQGIEVHAWFNLYKVYGPGLPPQSFPEHPARAYRRWVIHDHGEAWLDPGIPQVRAYLLSVALDLVRRYDVDGINFDYIRYPGKDFQDDFTYRVFGRGLVKEDWRRDNINQFVAAFHDSAKAIKPLLKIGAAPLGVYNEENNGTPNGSYNSVFQDSYGWLRSGKMDYLTPQMYWGLNPGNGDPAFARLVHMWEGLTAGRHVYPGIGAFKPEVFRDLDAQIDTVRAAGLPGIAFYRFGNIDGSADIRSRFAAPAFIPPMRWIDSTPPPPPANLVASEISPGIFQLEWTPPPAAANGIRCFAIYRSSGERVDSSTLPTGMAPGDKNFFVDTVAVPLAGAYRYTVSAFDRENSESAASNIAEGTVREILAMKRALSYPTMLAAPSADSTGALIGYALSDRMAVSIDVHRENEDSTAAPPTVLVSGVQDRGTYVVGLSAGQLKPGKYLVRLTAGGSTLEQPLELR